MITNIIKFCRHNMSRRVSFLAGLALLFIAGLLDFAITYEAKFTVFYIAAIFLMTIAVPKSKRFIIVSVTACMAIIIDILNKPDNITLAIFIWNSIMTLSLYIGIPQIISAYIDEVEMEAVMSMRDVLTGLYNRKAFYELAETELQKSRRYGHVFSVVYIDCDKFKNINDTFGHNTGDLLLKTVGHTLMTNLRNTDIIARLGGDEFIVFLPETKDVCFFMDKIRTRLNEVMIKNGWPVSFSMGVVTFLSAPANLDEMVMKADAAMYEVKNGSKNSIQCHIY